MNWFIDNNGNLMVEVRRYGRYIVIEMKHEPGHGYVTDEEWSNIYPGPCVSWYGPGERYPTADDLLNCIMAWDAKQEEDNAQLDPAV